MHIRPPGRDAADIKHLTELFFTGKLVSGLKCAIQDGVPDLIMNLYI